MVKEVPFRVEVDVSPVVVSLDPTNVVVVSNGGRVNEEFDCPLDVV